MGSWKALPIAVFTAVLFLGCAGAVQGEDLQKDEPLPKLVQDYDVPPKALEITRPEYPPEAFEQGVEGTVLLELVIDAKGKVARVKVLESILPLDEAAIRCAKKWRFKPAQKDGRPVATTAHAPIAFRRDGQKDTKS
jgi:TonB family protein